MNLCKYGHDVSIRGRDKKGSCRACKGVYQKKYRHDPKNIEKRRITDARAKSKRKDKTAVENRRKNLRVYGLTMDSYQQKLINQNNKCAVCHRDQSEFRYRFAVDHNHSTGQIRGLLCAHCNGVIVRIVEVQSDLLRKAEDYLKVHNTEVGWGNSWADAK